MRCPNTPFATRLSGSAKETQLRIRSIFQWKKQRIPVWLMGLAVVAILGCGWIFGIRTQIGYESSHAPDGWVGIVAEKIFAQRWLLKTFESDELAQILHYGTAEEREIAETVLAQAEQAFSALGLTKEQAEETYGLLSRYVMYGLEDIEEQHSLKLLSAKITGNEGTMWVHYSQKAIDAQGNTRRGSSDILTMWTIQKDANENWCVANIKEPA